MAAEKIYNLLEMFKSLSPAEKGELFSLFLLQEKKNLKLDRKSLFGSVKISSELTDSDIQSCEFDVRPNDLLD